MANEIKTREIADEKGEWFAVVVPMWLTFQIKASSPSEAIKVCSNLLSVGWWGNLRRQGQLAFNDMEISVRKMTAVNEYISGDKL
jgi:hypothetical protein